MRTIIGYTDSITECECCGKTDLKGTYCLDIDGVELYYGSTCAFKSHGVTVEEQKKAKTKFTKEVKLSEMLATSNNTDYAKSKIIAFVQKKGLDLVSFVKKHGEMVEDAKFYIAYQYGSKTYIFNK
jgi:ribosome-binding protein aMBF1 (putative translation factor)